MPSKSRRKRSKSVPPGKKTRARAGTPPVEQARTTAEPVEEAAAVAAAPVRPRPRTARSAPGNVPVPQVQDAAVRYMHVKTELLTIGILAIVMLAILGILSAVL
jgi:hypothetical protein